VLGTEPSAEKPALARAGITLAPAVGTVLMSVSTIVVALNAQFGGASTYAPGPPDRRLPGRGQLGSRICMPTATCASALQSEATRGGRLTVRLIEGYPEPIACLKALAIARWPSMVGCGMQLIFPVKS